MPKITNRFSAVGRSPEFFRTPVWGGQPIILGYGDVIEYCLQHGKDRVLLEVNADDYTVGKHTQRVVVSGQLFVLQFEVQERAEAG